MAKTKTYKKTIRGATDHEANASTEGGMFKMRQVKKVPADQVGPGSGFRYYGGEGTSRRLNIARSKAGMRALGTMASAPQDSIPQAQIGEYLYPEKKKKKKKGGFFKRKK